MSAVAGLVISAAALILSAVSLIAGSRQPDQESAGEAGSCWDGDCYCCAAGCGTADENNVCLICGH